MTKLEELDELRGKYFDKFDTMFPLWDMSIDKAISSIRKCLEEDKPFEDSVPDDVYT